MASKNAGSPSGIDCKLAAQIRRDVDLVFPSGGYTRAWREDERLHLSWASNVHRNLKLFSEELVRMYDVPFETDDSDPKASQRRKPPRRVK